MDRANLPRVLSGIMPTGDLHIGNYLGAILNWVKLQSTHESFFCVVDLHAITTPQDPATLREKIKEVAALYLAAGIDPKISAIFVQSDVPNHPELSWILNCYTPMGWLEKMTQFKEKAGAGRERASVGLFDYPVLQAADILLYGGVPPRPLFVPVGADQKQHLELSRNLAERFNHAYGEVFAIPEPIIPESGARIMGLDNPEKKMSKSEKNQYHALRLLESPEMVRKKISRAVTDAGREIVFDESRAGLYNLLTIYELFSKKSRTEIQAQFQGKGYGELKRELTDLVVDGLRPVQERYAEIRREPGYLDDVLARGAEKARETSSVVLDQVKTAIGLGR